MPRDSQAPGNGYRGLEPVAEAVCQYYNVPFCMIHYNKSGDNNQSTDRMYLGEYHSVKGSRFSVLDNETGQSYRSIYTWCVSVDKRTKISLNVLGRVQVGDKRRGWQ